MIDHLHYAPFAQGICTYMRAILGRGVQMRGVGGETSLATTTRFHAEPHTWQDVTIIWTIANNFSDPPYWAADIANGRTHMNGIFNTLNSVGNSSYYMMSIMNGFGVSEDSPAPAIRNAAFARRALNEEFAAQLGSRFIDAKAMINAQDPTDLLAVSGNYMPYSMRDWQGGQTHLNVVGNKLVARMICDRIVALGD